MKINRVVVVGAGAVGGSIAGLVAESGMPVAMVARGEHGREIRKHGLRLQKFDGDLITKADCFESISEVDWRSGDIAVLATKLNDAQHAMDQIATFAGKQTAIVCATNGVIGEVWAESRFENVIGMMVWVLASHLEPGLVMLHTDKVRGVLDVGATQPYASDYSSEFAGVLRHARFDSKSRDDIMAWKRAKWITNLGGAAQALVSDDWMSVLKAAQAEGEIVLQKSGLSRIEPKQFSTRCSSARMTDTPGFERGGGSTWQSHRRGKPLESIYIEGAMADLGESLGVLTPVNRFLSEVSKRPRAVHRDEILG